jgi:hypothetical protein
MPEFENVTIKLPTDDYSIIEFSQDDKPGMMTVNAALKNFEDKHPFAWHLSVLVLLGDTIKDNMPSQTEQQAMVDFEKKLDTVIRQAGNALYLATITQDGQCEMIWRVYNPETANDFLHGLIEAEDHSRPFEFTLEQDITWTKAKFPLESLDGEYHENDIDGPS